MGAPKVLLFGTGSIGSVYAYLLSLTPASFTTVCRSNYDAVSTAGITLNSTLYGTNITVKPTHTVRNVADAESHGPYDFIFVASKALLNNSTNTSTLIAPAVTNKTAIVLLQNGVGIEDDFLTRFPHNPLLSGVVYLPATQTSPGVIQMGGTNMLEVGTCPASPIDSASSAASAALRGLRDLLAPTGLDLRAHDDVQPRRWAKLLVNAAWNPVCALTLSSDAYFLSSSAAALPFVRSVMAEVVGVAQALGYAEVDEGEAERQLERARARVGTQGVEPSMLADVRGKRSLEVEAILGNAVRIAEREGVETPGLKALYALTKGLDGALRR